ncbi:MAG: DUF6067 family protein [Kiritimatiellae bacterium]|nr:DUF6067 family protein [Kiritimatiellia bacterium]MDD5522014.1 DUF6067 family protein [Kiritimatiellia bacterium]
MTQLTRIFSLTVLVLGLFAVSVDHLCFAVDNDTAEPLKLISPWTPVVTRTNASGVEVGVWGRMYKFAGGVLPNSIVTAGEEVLAAPIRLICQVSGKPVEWERGGSFVFNADKDRAIVSSWQTCDELIVDTTTRVEFDGMMRVDLVVMPQRKKSPKIEKLWLEVPLKRAYAGLYQFWPGTWGTAKNSGLVPETGMMLPFKPSVWLGWENGGLGWFMESDKNWLPKDPKQSIEIVASGDQTVLRLHLLDSPPLQLPVTFTMGFQASPVKPMPEDFHEWRICHAPQLGVGATLPVPENWWFCHRAFPDGNAEGLLDRGEKLGVKTLVFHEDWTPVQNYPAVPQEAELKWLIKACHKRGMKILFYFGYELSSLAPEWGAVSDEVLVKNVKGNVTGGWYRPPKQRDYVVCYNSRWGNMLTDKIIQFIERYGADGVYLDGTIEPWACANEKHGCGYRADDGSIHSTYPIFAVRRFMQRLYAVIQPRGGLINVHQSGCCVMPTLAFAHSYWDGEQFAGGELMGDPLKGLPLEAFRAEFMGRNFGVPCEFLAYERPPTWTFGHALAFTMLHNVRVRPCGLGHSNLDLMSSIWSVMSKFKIAEAEWHPYWNNGKLLTLQPESAKVSLYLRRGKSAGSGKVLLVVSNLSAEQQTTARLNLNVSALGLRSGRVAKDALNGERLSSDGDSLLVPLQPMRMRLIWIE